MNETILLIVLFIVFLAIQVLVSLYESPVSKYLKIASPAVLLVLVWFFAPGSAFGPKLILSGLALSAIVKEIANLQKSRKKM